MTKPKRLIPEELPILPVRDTVLFPGAVMPLPVGRESSLALLDSLGTVDDPVERGTHYVKNLVSALFRENTPQPQRQAAIDRRRRGVGLHEPLHDPVFELMKADDHQPPPLFQHRQCCF